MPVPSDDRRHEPGPGSDWEESWYFDFVVDGGAFGGFVRLGLRPVDGRAWWWTSLTGDRRPLVAVRDHDVELPPGRALEVRASGLWAEVTTETPLEHWSVGLEAFGVVFDDPDEAWRAERGDPVPVGLDLEWEAAGDRHESVDLPPAFGTGYAQPCSVHGEVLVGPDRLQIDARGWRAHAWGDRRWWPAPAAAYTWVAGHLTDGAPVTSEGDGVTVVTAERAPVLVDAAGGRVSRLDRSLCRFETADHRRGAGWCESAGGGA